MSSLPLAALAAPTGFAADPRFMGASQPLQPPPLEPSDPLAQAWEEGHAAGFDQARAEHLEQAAAEAAARARIELSFERLDAELTEQLRRKLFATVEALCEAAIAPLALDRDALASRVDRAAAMLARSGDERLLRLHPDDIVLLAERLPEGLAVAPDPALERGALRIESSNGGIEDGPAHWRRAITEALAQC